MSAPIAVFDIDGTLTDTMAVDMECYEVAVREVVGVEIPERWPTLEEITDSAILAAACEAGGQPRPDRATERRIADRVGELLSAAAERTPERFAPIPGARSVFAALQVAGWRVAMATGAWRPSALVKLAAARIPDEGIPLATSSDCPARSDIIRHAVSALDEAHSGPVVYVGDGVWDGRAATSLGYGFVGVGPDGKRERLMGVGAVGVIPDHSDTARLLRYLDLARS